MRVKFWKEKSIHVQFDIFAPKFSAVQLTTIKIFVEIKEIGVDIYVTTF